MHNAERLKRDAVKTPSDVVAPSDSWRSLRMAWPLEAHTHITAEQFGNASTIVVKVWLTHIYFYNYIMQILRTAQEVSPPSGGNRCAQF